MSGKNQQGRPIKEDAEIIKRLNEIAASEKDYLSKVEAAQELIRRIPIEERTALMLHFSKEPERSREIAKRVARRETFELILLKSRRRPSEESSRVFRLHAFGNEPERKVKLFLDKAVQVEAREAFTLLTQHNGLIGEEEKA